MEGYYYSTRHLAEFRKISEGSPELGRRFFEYYGKVFADGALTARTTKGGRERVSFLRLSTTNSMSLSCTTWIV